MKRCTKCLVPKKALEFFADRSKHDGLYSSCKRCVNETLRTNRLAAAKRWRKRNPERMRAYKIAETERNRKPPRVKDVTAPSRAKSSWKARNPNRVAEDRVARRARELKAMPTWANRFFMAEAYDLARRRAEATGFEWEVDHEFPLRHKLFCGLHVEYNLRVIPAVINRKKGNRVPPELLGASI